jgi:hypothetical protein
MSEYIFLILTPQNVVMIITTIIFAFFITLIFCSSRGTFEKICSLKKDEGQNSGRYREEINRDYLIFWAVLFFTCLVGIIGLLSFIHENLSIELLGKFDVYVIYFVLLAGILLSFSRCVNIMREGKALTENGILGVGFREYVEANDTFTKIYINIWVEIIFLFGIFLVFETLYFVLIGWL